MNVILTHPNRQYTHQLAIALHRAGLLEGYWTGVPARPVFEGTPLRPFGRLLEKHPLIDEIPSEQIEHSFWGPLARRVALPFPKKWAVVVQHLGVAVFDWWCARRILDTQADVVAGVENAVLETFRTAKTCDMTTVLEAPSFHHEWQDHFYDYPESDAVHARINERKNREIELADRIHTVSALARESYVDAGVPPEKVIATTIGCDISHFQPRTNGTLAESSGPFTFIFAGHAGRRKGADTLLRACERLDQKGVSYRVWIAGEYDESLSWERTTSINRLGWLPHEELVNCYQEADCLVLPSRHDSFGMVVVEAMACGTPAIVSEHTGAREAITENESGWVLPADDAEALAARMEWCAGHASRMQEMRSAARSDAEHYDWPQYRKRAVSAYESLHKDLASGAVRR